MHIQYNSNRIIAYLLSDTVDANDEGQLGDEEDKDDVDVDAVPVALQSFKDHEDEEGEDETCHGDDDQDVGEDLHMHRRRIQILQYNDRWNAG